MIAPPKPPAQDDHELLIKEARERQLRRRLLAAAGVAIAAALGLSIYALTIGDGGQSAAAKGSPRGAAPVCRSSQLSVSIGGQGATQMVLGGAEITNTGGQACTLPVGRPVVRLTWDGRPMRVREPVPRSGEVQSGTPARVLAPGSKALVSMRWGNWCGRRMPGLPTMTLLFGNGLTVSAPGLGVPRCIGPGSPGFLDVSRPLIES
jgi:Domain of unknown function (DUF4232)